MKPARRIVAAAALMLLAGCTSTRVGDFTVGSPKNLSHRFTVLGGEVTGEDCTHLVLLLIPIGQLNPTTDGAVDAALKQVAGADALIDATVHKEILFTPIYSRVCMNVVGKPINTRGNESE